MSFPSREQHTKYRTRMLAMTVTIVSAMTLIGGSLATTPTPASAAAGGTNVCASGVATFDPSTGVSTGTLTGCHQQGSGTTVQVANLADPFAPTPFTIHWATGHATSEAIATPGPHLGVNPCPAGDVAGDISIVVVRGLYAGSTGGYVICLDLSTLPALHATSAGPIVI